MRPVVFSKILSTINGSLNLFLNKLYLSTDTGKQQTQINQSLEVKLQSISDLFSELSSKLDSTTRNNPADLSEKQIALELNLKQLKDNFELILSKQQIDDHNIKNYIDTSIKGVMVLEGNRSTATIALIGETALNIRNEFESKIATELTPQIIRTAAAVTKGINFPLHQLLTQKTVTEAKNIITDIWSLDEYHEYFKAKAPLHHTAYLECFNVGAESYDALPAQSCSTDAHAESLLFKDYLSPYLSGIVLDIGCGPQYVPSYLVDYPYESIIGLDPLPATTDHPFTFIQAFAEKLPLESNSVSTVVSATTLDHYYLLDEGLEEICRVLEPGGFFVAWITHFENAPAYNPYAECELPYDSEHMYHISLDWFLPYLSTKTTLVTHHIIEIKLPFKYLFMVFRKQ